ncbi:hypothetical protein D3C71_1384650 [compost metagenome]
MVLDHDYACADADEQTSRFAAHVTKALYRHFGTFKLYAQTFGHFTTGHEHATAGRFFTAQRAAQVDRLTGDNAGDGSAVVHGVGIHHPGHHFGVGADVRCRDVFLWPDDKTDFAGVATGQSFQLAFRQFERIDADPPLGATVRQVNCRTFDGHPG